MSKLRELFGFKENIPLEPDKIPPRHKYRCPECGYDYCQCENNKKIAAILYTEKLEAENEKLRKALWHIRHNLPDIKMCRYSDAMRNIIDKAVQKGGE